MRKSAHQVALRSALAAALAGSALVLALAGCSGSESGADERLDSGTQPVDSTRVDIPAGASALAIGNALRDAGLIRTPRGFALYVRLRGAQSELKSGQYSIPSTAGWADILEQLRRGQVLTLAVTIPEGFTLREIAPRLAEVSGVTADSVVALAQSPDLTRQLGVPGPTLEGYLLPETYRFAEGVDPETVLRAMALAYLDFWTPERRALADSLGLDERELVTLASIVEEEARRPEERSLIASVYLNRLRIGMLLQADPTVQYALGAPRERLLYRDIDSVADNPYNTYTHLGLPPGPISSPGAATLDATLRPEEADYLYFVARPDGSHVFTRSAREHINAKNRIRRGG